MFKKWRAYESARIERAWKETKWTTFLGWSFFTGCLGLIGQWKSGVQSEHDALVKIAVAFGCAVIGGLCVLFLKLISLPATIAAEQQKNLDSTIAAKDSEINSLRQEKEQLKQQLEKLPEKPFVSVEGLMMPYGVQDFSGFRHGLPVGLDIAPIKMVEKFFVKVRNQSSFAVNIDAVGFMVKDTPLQGYFVDDSNTPVSFPIRLDARASL